MPANTKNQEQPQAQKGATLSPQQIQAAAQSAVQLIAQGRLDVPSDMAMNGTLGVLNATLISLAKGETVLVSPIIIKELQEKVEASKKKPRKKAPAKKVNKKR